MNIRLLRKESGEIVLQKQVDTMLNLAGHYVAWYAWEDLPMVDEVEDKRKYDAKITEMTTNVIKYCSQSHHNHETTT